MNPYIQNISWVRLLRGISLAGLLFTTVIAMYAIASARPLIIVTYTVIAFLGHALFLVITGLPTLVILPRLKARIQTFLALYFAVIFALVPSIVDMIIFENQKGNFGAEWLPANDGLSFNIFGALYGAFVGMTIWHMGIRKPAGGKRP